MRLPSARPLLPAPTANRRCCLPLSALLFSPSAAAAADEPQRYAALVAHLEEQWRRDVADKGVAAAAEATLPYVPLAKWCVAKASFVSLSHCLRRLYTLAACPPA